MSGGGLPDGRSAAEGVERLDGVAKDIVRDTDHGRFDEVRDRYEGDNPRGSQEFRFQKIVQATALHLGLAWAQVTLCDDDLLLGTKLKA